MNRVKTTRNGDQLSIVLEGSIGESTSLFTLPLGGVRELILDLGGVTYINSIGVKQWILWTLKIPAGTTVKMFNCPFVFASQASMVMGFLTKRMFIESLRLPYACEDCGFEQSYMAARGKDFEYASAGKPAAIKVPEALPCPKCKLGKLEPDFFSGKTFKFLS